VPTLASTKTAFEAIDGEVRLRPKEMPMKIDVYSTPT
jgi:hypothetical protein